LVGERERERRERMKSENEYISLIFKKNKNIESYFE